MLDSESMYPNIYCSTNHTNIGSKMALYVQRTLKHEVVHLLAQMNDIGYS